jgi:hypothetical protein
MNQKSLKVATWEQEISYLKVLGIRYASGSLRPYCTCYELMTERDDTLHQYIKLERNSSFFQIIQLYFTITMRPFDHKFKNRFLVVAKWSRKLEISRWSRIWSNGREKTI